MTDNERAEILGLIADLAREVAKLSGGVYDGMNISTAHAWRGRLEIIAQRAEALNVPWHERDVPEDFR